MLLKNTGTTYLHWFSRISKKTQRYPCKSQYGFQKKISTAHAVLDLVTTSFDNINNNLYTGLLFLDLRKAFDTVSHEILLSKLDHYGIRGSAHKLMQSFLNRKQFVGINGVNSEVERGTYGVAQGSTLSPLLFLLYINDLPCSTNCLPRLFADDTCLVINSPNLGTLENLINEDLANVYKWLQAKKLHLNSAKSNYLIVAPKMNPISSQIC